MSVVVPEGPQGAKCTPIEGATEEVRPNIDITVADKIPKERDS